MLFYHMISICTNSLITSNRSASVCHIFFLLLNGDHHRETWNRTENPSRKAGSTSTTKPEFVVIVVYFITHSHVFIY